jgi:hypothetical protein
MSAPATAAAPKGDAVPAVTAALVTDASADAALDGASATDAGSDAATASARYAGKTVLHCGDSMVGGGAGLSRYLEGQFKAAGAKRVVVDTVVSASILTFDQQPRLRDLLNRHHPDVVVVTLGANDVFVPNPASLLPFIKGIIKKIGSRECYWISPPTWKPDTGIVELLRDNVAPCKFYDSRNLDIPRAVDHIHPTDKGGAIWGEKFWTKLQDGTL